MNQQPRDKCAPQESLADTALTCLGSPERLTRLSDPEFEATLKIFQQERVEPIVAWELEQLAAHGVCVPESRLAWAKEALTSAKASAGFLSVALGTVLDILEKENFVPIGLKGCDVAHRFYPLPHLRSMGDFDLLFRGERAAEDAFAALQANGYRTLSGPPRAGIWTFSHELPELVAPHGGVRVEIQGSLLYPPRDRRAARTAALLQGTRTIKVEGHTLEVLCPEACVVYLFAHAFEHHVDTPPLFRVLSDVRQVLRVTAENFSWEKWWSLSEESGLQVPSMRGAALLQAHLGQKLPDFLNTRAVATLPGSVAMLAGQEATTAQQISRLVNAGSLGGAARLVTAAIFPAPRFMRDRYREKGRWPVIALYPYRWILHASRVLRLLGRRSN